MDLDCENKITDDTGDKLEIKSDEIDAIKNDRIDAIKTDRIDAIKNDEIDVLKSDKKDAIKNDEIDDNEIKNSADSSIDSNIEILNQDEISFDKNDDKENVNCDNKIKIKIEREDFYLPGHNNLSLDLSLDRSKTSIDDLSFSQRTLIKSCSLRSLITELVNDEILIDKNELSKDLDEFEKEKFFQIIKAIKLDDSDKKVEQLKELCKYFFLY